MSLSTEKVQEKILVELQKHTGLLEQIALNQIAFIEALADGEDVDRDPDAEPGTYLDGSPCR